MQLQAHQITMQEEQYQIISVTHNAHDLSLIDIYICNLITNYFPVRSMQTYEVMMLEFKSLTEKKMQNIQF